MEENKHYKFHHVRGSRSGIYYIILEDGSKSYYIRPRNGNKGTWLQAGTSLTEARKLRRAYLQQRRHGALGIKTPEKIRFRELAAKYLEQYERDRTETDPLQVARIKSSIKKLNECFGDTWAHSITTLAIDKAALPRQERIYLRAILRKGKRWNYIDEVPEIKVEDSGNTRRALSPEEINIILEQASEIHADAIKLSLGLVMRLGELCKTSQRNTDFEKGIITIKRRKHPKGKANPKVFAIPDSEIAAMLKRRFIENGGKLFEHADNYLSQIFGKERKSIKGIKEPWDFHCIRHTAITWLEQDGISGKLLQSISGHKSIQTTYDRYVDRPDIEREREALGIIRKRLDRI